MKAYISFYHFQGRKNMLIEWTVVTMSFDLMTKGSSSQSANFRGALEGTETFCFASCSKVQGNVRDKIMLQLLHPTESNTVLSTHPVAFLFFWCLIIGYPKLSSLFNLPYSHRQLIGWLLCSLSSTLLVLSSASFYNNNTIPITLSAQISEWRELCHPVYQNGVFKNCITYFSHI